MGIRFSRQQLNQRPEANPANPQNQSPRQPKSMRTADLPDFFFAGDGTGKWTPAGQAGEVLRNPHGPRTSHGQNHGVNQEQCDLNEHCGVGTHQQDSGDFPFERIVPSLYFPPRHCYWHGQKVSRITVDDPGDPAKRLCESMGLSSPANLIRGAELWHLHRRTSCTAMILRWHREPYGRFS